MSQVVVHGNTVYLAGVVANKAAGESVTKQTQDILATIDGLCASACTIVLGAIPHDRICVTSSATLGFHAAWDFGSNGRAVTNPEATQMLYAMYPSQVKRWISQRGGLTPHMLFLKGKQLQTMYKPCYLDAQASTIKPARRPLPQTDQIESARGQLLH